MFSWSAGILFFVSILFSDNSALNSGGEGGGGGSSVVDRLVIEKSCVRVPARVVRMFFSRANC